MSTLKHSYNVKYFKTLLTIVLKLLVMKTYRHVQLHVRTGCYKQLTNSCLINILNYYSIVFRICMKILEDEFYWLVFCR